MKTYKITNFGGEFFIRLSEEGESDFTEVWGSVRAATRAFKSIHRMPPNKYGSFYKREKAGRAACLELVEKYCK